jgi:hypothetical protein
MDKNFMKKLSLHSPMMLSATILLLSALACNVFAAPRPVPTTVPPIPTSTPLPLSQQVTVVPQALNETNQTPPFTITAQTPQLTGSNDPRVTAFNQRLNDLVSKEVDTWRQSFLQNTAPVVNNGSSLNVKYTLVSQIVDLWSFKFDFDFYSDGAAHPGLNSVTLNYDLAQGKELALSDLFLPNSDYLGVISNYCVNELSKQPFFDSTFAEGAKPTPENYRNWNITPDGLMITFDEYQVAPYAAGPQTINVPYSELKSLLNPQGPLARFVQ